METRARRGLRPCPLELQPDGGRGGQIQGTERHMLSVGPEHTRPEGSHRLWEVYQAVAWKRVSRERNHMVKCKGWPQNHGLGVLREDE